MNASKTLISAIAAATIVGTVGFVSAQTSTDPAAPSSAQSTEPVQTQTPATTQSTQPADMSAPPYVAPSTGSSVPATDPNAAAEPAPQADRN